MRVQRLVATASLLTVAVAPLAGCSTQAADAAVLVRDAPTKTASAKTARLALTVSSTSSNAAATTSTADGLIDLRSQASDFTIDPKIAGNSAKLHMLTLGTIIYMQIPPQMRAQAGGKSFVKIDLQAAAKAQGLDLAALQEKRPDADSQMAILSGAGSDFSKVGTEQVRATTTTHYRGTVDLVKANQNASPAAKAAVEKLRQQLGTATLPMDVWLDGKGRLRKMVYRVDLGKIAAATGKSGVTGQLTETMELYDYGVPVHVVAPPADQVTDLAALQASTK